LAVRNVLVSWVGKTDLRAPTETATVGLGPIAQALDARSFDNVFLISDYPEKEVRAFLDWLGPRSTAKISTMFVKLSGPTDFGEIYEAASKACVKAVGKERATTALTCHLSPGTPAMAAVWIILAKTRFPAELIESSKDHGVRTASVPSGACTPSPRRANLLLQNGCNPCASGARKSNHLKRRMVP